MPPPAAGKGVPRPEEAPEESHYPPLQRLEDAKPPRNHPTTLDHDTTVVYPPNPRAVCLGGASAGVPRSCPLPPPAVSRRQRRLPAKEPPSLPPGAPGRWGVTGGAWLAHYPPEPCMAFPGAPGVLSHIPAKIGG
ncbi:hypothetical protein Tco_0469061 [Tanacetum coccineum]